MGVGLKLKIKELQEIYNIFLVLKKEKFVIKNFREISFLINDIDLPNSLAIKLLFRKKPSKTDKLKKLREIKQLGYTNSFINDEYWPNKIIIITHTKSINTIDLEWDETTKTYLDFNQEENQLKNLIVGILSDSI